MHDVVVLSFKGDENELSTVGARTWHGSEQFDGLPWKLVYADYDVSRRKYGVQELWAACSNGVVHDLLRNLILYNTHDQ